MDVWRGRHVPDAADSSTSCSIRWGADSHEATSYRGISQLLSRAIMHERMDAYPHPRTHASMQTCNDARSAVSLRVNSILLENVLRRGQQ